MILALVFYSLLIFASNLAGGMLPLVFKHAHDSRLKLFVSLGAGLLLGMAFLHMMPESARILPLSFGWWLLVGFLILLVLERFVMVHACEEGGCDFHTVGLAAFSGLTIHGMIEGFALGSSMFVGSIAPLVLVAIVSHKMPTAFALTSILRLSGKTNKQILAFLLGVAISGPVGLYVAYLIIDKSLPDTAGVLLALSSGTFIYIAACDLLPELHRGNDEKMKRLGAFLLGIVMSYLSGLIER